MLHAIKLKYNSKILHYLKFYNTIKIEIFFKIIV